MLRRSCTALFPQSLDHVMASVFQLFATAKRGWWWGGKLYIDVLTRHCVLIKIMIAFFFIYSLLQGKKYAKLSVRGYWLQFVRVYK